MTEAANRFYDQLEIPFTRDLTSYLTFGYVSVSPKHFLLFKPIDHTAEKPPHRQWFIQRDQATSWYIKFLIKDPDLQFKDLLKVLPYELPNITFSRMRLNGQVIPPRTYPTSRLKELL